MDLPVALLVFSIGLNMLWSAWHMVHFLLVSVEASPMVPGVAMVGYPELALFSAW
jgi:hypothetical protein